MYGVSSTFCFVMIASILFSLIIYIFCISSFIRIICGPQYSLSFSLIIFYLSVIYLLTLGFLVLVSLWIMWHDNKTFLHVSDLRMDLSVYARALRWKAPWRTNLSLTKTLPLQCTCIHGNVLCSNEEFICSLTHRLTHSLTHTQTNSLSHSHTD